MSVRPPGSEEPRRQELPVQRTGNLRGHTVKPQHGGLLGCLTAFFSLSPTLTDLRMHPKWEGALKQAQGREFHDFIDLCVTYPREGKIATRNHLERELNAVLKEKKFLVPALQMLKESLSISKTLPDDFKKASRELRRMVALQRVMLKQEISVLRTEWQSLDYGVSGAKEREAELSTSISQKQEVEEQLERYEETILNIGVLDDQQTERLLTSWTLHELAEHHVTQSNLIKEIWPNFVARRDKLANEFTTFLHEQGLAPAEMLPKFINCLTTTKNPL